MEVFMMVDGQMTKCMDKVRLPGRLGRHKETNMKDNGNMASVMAMVLTRMQVEISILVHGEKILWTAKVNIKELCKCRLEVQVVHNFLLLWHLRHPLRYPNMQLEVVRYQALRNDQIMPAHP